MHSKFCMAALIVAVAGEPDISLALTRPPLTQAQERLAHRCWAGADARTGDIFTYPLRVSVPTGWSTLGVFVNPTRWSNLPRSERIYLLGNIACGYAGGMDRHYWYSFSVGDAATGKIIETFVSVS